MIRPLVSVPISAVVSEACIRWVTSPVLARSTVTSTPVTTQYAGCPASDCTTLLFQIRRS